MAKWPWDHKRDEFKQRFFGYKYESLPELAKDLELPWHVASDWLYRPYKGEISLKKQRDDLESGIRAEAIKRAINELSSALKKSGNVMTKLLDMIEKNIDAGLYSPKDLVEIFAKLGASLKGVHSTVRLEEGKSTANLAVANELMDMQKVNEAIRFIKQDPLANVELIESETLNVPITEESN